MKSIWVAVVCVILLLPFVLSGQAKQFPQDYVETTTFSLTDVLLIVLNPGTTPATRKITVSNLRKHSHPCEILFGGPDATTALPDTADAPQSCGNVSGADATITAVACYADAGTPSILPVLTGGGAILTGAFSCGANSWAAGTISGTPTLHSFSANGATCAVTPCTLSANIDSAGGTAKYIVIRFTISGQ